MAAEAIKVKQSSGVAMIGVTRRDGKKGEAEIAWFVEVVHSGVKKSSPEQDAYYNKLDGKVRARLASELRLVELVLKLSCRNSG